MGFAGEITPIRPGDAGPDREHHLDAECTRGHRRRRGVATPRKGRLERMAYGGSSVSRSSGLADVIELILDKGLVIDAFIRVSLIGIEVLTIDVRVVVASVDMFLRFAEATNRLD